ncbi:hypothetical protein HOY82DRAFT_536515 [Tuber indicum]|nr:hypothetical protein HOY82DRAFT_536515 [Tuber indicum]
MEPIHRIAAAKRLQIFYNRRRLTGRTTSKRVTAVQKGNRAAHNGDFITDLAMLQRGDISDGPVFYELCGIPYENAEHYKSRRNAIKDGLPEDEAEFYSQIGLTTGLLTPNGILEELRTSFTRFVKMGKMRVANPDHSSKKWDQRRQRQFEERISNFTDHSRGSSEKCHDRQPHLSPSTETENYLTDSRSLGQPTSRRNTVKDGLPEDEVEICSQIGLTTGLLTPNGFLEELRTSFPRFAKKGTYGHYGQQGAEEWYSHIISLLKQKQRIGLGGECFTTWDSFIDTDLSGEMCLVPVHLNIEINKRANCNPKVIFPFVLDATEFCTEVVRSEPSTASNGPRDLRKAGEDCNRTGGPLGNLKCTAAIPAHFAGGVVPANGFGTARSRLASLAEEKKEGDAVAKSKEADANLGDGEQGLIDALDPDIAQDERCNMSVLYELMGVISSSVVHEPARAAKSFESTSRVATTPLHTALIIQQLYKIGGVNEQSGSTKRPNKIAAYSVIFSAVFAEPPCSLTLPVYYGNLKIKTTSQRTFSPRVFSTSSHISTSAKRLEPNDRRGSSPLGSRPRGVEGVEPARLVHNTSYNP